MLRAISLLLLAIALPALAQERAALEHEVKAVFLFKFPGYIEWPQGSAEPRPLVIAVLGDTDVLDALRNLARGRSVNGRPIEVRDSAQGAHMVFIGRGERSRLPELAKSLQGAPVLLVSDWPGARDQGSMINFLMIDGRVRFEVALGAAERAGLRISSRLLAVAEDVRTSRP